MAVEQGIAETRREHVHTTGAHTETAPAAQTIVPVVGGCRPYDRTVIGLPCTT